MTPVIDVSVKLDLCYAVCNEMTYKCNTGLARVQLIILVLGKWGCTMHRASKSVNVLCLLICASFSSCKAHALGVKAAGVEAHLSKQESDLLAGTSHISKNPPLTQRGVILNPPSKSAAKARDDQCCEDFTLYATLSWQHTKAFTH